MNEITTGEGLMSQIRNAANTQVYSNLTMENLRQMLNDMTQHDNTVREREREAFNNLMSFQARALMYGTAQDDNQEFRRMYESAFNTGISSNNFDNAALYTQSNSELDEEFEKFNDEINKESTDVKTKDITRNKLEKLPSNIKFKKIK